MRLEDQIQFLLMLVYFGLIESHLLPQVVYVLDIRCVRGSVILIRCLLLLSPATPVSPLQYGL